MSDTEIMLNHSQYSHRDVSQDTSCIKHERPYCIRHITSRLRLEFVYLIQHGRSCFIYYLQLVMLKCGTLGSKDYFCG